VTSETVLDIRGLSAGYARDDGSVSRVVEDVSLRLERGRIAGLVGESGCGKSTTALAAIGYRSPGLRIAAGESRLGGVDLLALPLRELRALWGSKVAYVAQSAAVALNPALTVGRQLAQPLAVHLGLNRRAAHARSVELLDAMGLRDPVRALRRYPFQFSGGQQQRLGLAIALSCEPELLILDEPTTGLDVTTQARITELLRSLVDDLRLGCLYVSHDLALLGTIADSTAVMYAGELVESGPATAVVSKQRHPYTQALLAAVPSVTRPRQLAGIAGRPPAEAVLHACAFAARCPHAADECRSGHVPARDPGDGHIVRCVRFERIERPALRPVHVHRVPDDGPVLLELSGLQCDYAGSDTRAVRDVDLILHEAELVGIVGESGAGKSTLLRAIAGLHRPAAGLMTFAGVELPSPAVRRPREARRAIQLVFQNPDSSLNPRHTVLDLVARPIRLFREDVPRGRERDVVVGLLDSVGLPRGILHRYPAELSGGQRQRVALARAFAPRPSLLLCDEVTSALDVSVQATILTLIADLSAQTRTAVIWVSHDLAVVRAIADRALVMRDGVVCEESAIDQLFSAARHPYTQQLLAAVPELRH
jgi:peptide/nickel transport system ATP-binding protein